MNRAYIISNDGRIFFAEPDDEFFSPLESNETNVNNVKVKRLSSCPWCFWSISSNLNLYLFVYLLDTPYEHQLATYENQRRYNILNSHAFSDKLLPTDRPKFSSREGDLNLAKENFHLPSKNWIWKSDWFYEQNANEGWEYAIDFPSNYYPNLTKTSFVRRRKWTRNRLFTTYHQFIKIESPSVKECILDVSIGGWLIPFSDKGYLSVWIVTSSGRLYFRKNVSHANLEGEQWLNVKLPNEHEALSCSCSAKGDLWIVIDQGDALMRTGISRENPYGTGWSNIEAPTNASGLKEVSLSNNCVWGLDNKGQVFYRAGVTQRQPKGTKWVYIPSFMSNISCSLSDQLSTVNLLENKLYFRHGIDEENLSGTCWKTINLKYKLTYNQNKFEESSNSNISILTNNLNEPVPIKEEAEIEKRVIEKSETIEEKKVDYMDYSIYDDESIYGLKELETNFGKEDKMNKEVRNNEIVIDKYKNIDDLNLLGKKVQDTNRDLDYYIDNLIKKEELEEILKKSRSDSVVSFESTTETSSVISNTSDELSIKGQDFIYELDLHSICINSFNVNQIPIKWYDRIKTIETSENDFKTKLNSKWRESIFNDLIKRNLKEFLTIDKISVPYENDESWSRKEQLQVFYQKRLMQCTLETVHFNNSIKNSYISIKIKNKSNEIIEKIKFENILLVKPYVIDSKRSAPCLAIYQNENKSPFIFLLSSKNQLNEWLNQISIYCSKVYSFNSLSSALTLVTSDGYSYYFYLNEKNKALYLSQIDGHFKQVEKHLSGLTFGCGENGKLWFLKAPNIKTLDNYKGPFDQTDELEVYTYENQRWNVITGIFGSKSGFTKVGLPTDRYHWSDETGKIRRRKEECQLPSTMFEWISSWQIDYSLQPGVDKDGWQYAVDFPRTYHAVCNPIKHFVRRRRWVKKCRIVSKGLWKELNQSHKLTCISLDQERHSNKQLLKNDEILLWATDYYGCVLSALLNDSNPTNIKWKYVSCENQTFRYVSIGPNLKVWAIDSNGNVYYRAGVCRENEFCGIKWTKINYDEKDSGDEKFEQLSVGKNCVWAISSKKDLFFRENITKSFLEGTNWTYIDANLKYVSVNALNQVYAISSETANDPNALLFREGVTEKNLKGTDWKKILPIEIKTFSNKGYLKN